MFAAYPATIMEAAEGCLHYSGREGGKTYQKHMFFHLFEGVLISKMDLEQHRKSLEKPCFSIGFCLFSEVQDLQIRC